MILLDTNICVAALNEDPRVVTRMPPLKEELAIPCFTVAELYYGFMKSARVARNIPRLRHFLRLIKAVDFTPHTAEIAANIRLQLESIGRPTGETDRYIGAIAIEHSAILVTHNVRHFEAIAGIQIEDWLA